MNELDPFEDELRRLKPTKPPEEFVSQLSVVLTELSPRAKPELVQRAKRPVWPFLFRWLAPAMAVAAVLVSLSWHRAGPLVKNPPHLATQKARANSTLRADQVEIDRDLVGDFDAVAEMPNGEPVRFRCRQWADEVVLHDSSKGITIESRVPRLEVVPVSFETY